MEYKYSNKDIKDFDKFYNEAIVIGTYKKKVKSYAKCNRKFKIFNYVKRNIITLVIYALVLLVWNCLYFNHHEKMILEKEFIIILNIVIALFCIGLICALIIYFKQKNRIKSDDIDVTKFNKEGISLTEGKNEVLYKWDSFDCFVIGNYSSVILLSDTGRFIMLPPDEKIIDIIKKYKKDVNVIDLRD